jgi:hypothetical protein
MLVHPAIWKQVSKMLRWYYKTDKEVKNLFEFHNLLNGKEVTLDNLENLLNDLTFEQGIEIFEKVTKAHFFLNFKFKYSREYSKEDGQLLFYSSYIFRRNRTNEKME